MSGAITPLPNTPSWRGSHLKDKCPDQVVSFSHMLLTLSVHFLYVNLVMTSVSRNLSDADFVLPKI
jgi:hypothetical protein